MASPERFIVVADSHGPLLDPVCDKAVMAFIEDFKPTIRVHLGDGFDLAALRRGASQEEQAVSIDEDFAAAEDFLTRFFRGGRRNFYLEGNHDRVRIEQFTNNQSALIREAAEDALKDMDRIFRQCRAKVFPYDSRHGVLQLGKLNCIHGYASGANAVQKMARVYGHVLMGHIHTIETVAVENLHGPCEARSIGALCKLDQPYNARQTNKLRHSQGWCYGYLFSDGSYQLFQTRNIDGNFYAAHNIKAY